MSAEPVPITPSVTPQDSLIERYWDRAYRFAVFITGDTEEASDVAQEALARALAKVSRYDPDRGSFESWLWRIVLNVARDSRRAASRRQRRWERVRRFHWEPALEVEDLALQRLDDRAVLAAVRRLPDRWRAVIALRFGAELTYREIGDQLGISEAAALMATRRALAALKRDLSKEVSR